MQSIVDFSLFSSPVTAYGVVTGIVDVPVSTRVGDEVRLLFPNAKNDSGLKLKVVALERGNVDGMNVFSLEDLVVDSHEAAVFLARRFEGEAKLFCDVFNLE